TGLEPSSLSHPPHLLPPSHTRRQSMILFSFSQHCAPPDLHSFPTRRSSDLLGLKQEAAAIEAAVKQSVVSKNGTAEIGGTLGTRSEEHTSELQSRENLVCRLLLEKKNNVNKRLTCRIPTS